MIESLRLSLRHSLDAVCVSDRAGAIAALVNDHQRAAGFVVGGGDGTIFDVLQTCDRTRQTLAILPLGRGNSLARDLDVPTLARAIGNVTRGVDRTIDLLDVTLHSAHGDAWHGVSASNLAIGYPADVAHRALRFRPLGAHSYTAAGLVARPRRFSVALRIDDGPERVSELTGAIISNSKHVGPFLGFPQADLTDGVFHAMTLDAGRTRQLLHNLSSVTRLRFYEPGVVHDVRAIHLRFSEPMLVKIDGELRERIQAIDVRVLPRAATFRVPESRHG